MLDQCRDDFRTKAPCQSECRKNGASKIPCLENKLLLISINFTPKTSHGCLKKWYTMFSRCMEPIASSRCSPSWFLIAACRNMEISFNVSLSYKPSYHRAGRRSAKSFSPSGYGKSWDVESSYQLCNPQRRSTHVDSGKRVRESSMTSLVLRIPARSPWKPLVPNPQSGILNGYPRSWTEGPPECSFYCKSKWPITSCFLLPRVTVWMTWYDLDVHQNTSTFQLNFWENQVLVHSLANLWKNWASTDFSSQSCWRILGSLRVQATAKEVAKAKGKPFNVSRGEC